MSKPITEAEKEMRIELDNLLTGIFVRGDKVRAPILRISSLVDRILEAHRTAVLEEAIRAVGERRKEVWRFYHNCQEWAKQKEAVKPYDEIIEIIERFEALK